MFFECLSNNFRRVLNFRRVVICALLVLFEAYCAFLIFGQFNFGQKLLSVSCGKMIFGELLLSASCGKMIFGQQFFGQQWGRQFILFPIFMSTLSCPKFILLLHTIFQPLMVYVNFYPIRRNYVFILSGYRVFFTKFNNH